MLFIDKQALLLLALHYDSFCLLDRWTLCWRPLATPRQSWMITPVASANIFNCASATDTVSVEDDWRWRADELDRVFSPSLSVSCSYLLLIDYYYLSLPQVIYIFLLIVVIWKFLMLFSDMSNKKILSQVIEIFGIKQKNARPLVMV